MMTSRRIARFIGLVVLAWACSLTQGEDVFSQHKDSVITPDPLVGSMSELLNYARDQVTLRDLEGADRERVLRMAMGLSDTKLLMGEIEKEGYKIDFKNAKVMRALFEKSNLTVDIVSARSATGPKGTESAVTIGVPGDGSPSVVSGHITNLGVGTTVKIAPGTYPVFYIRVVYICLGRPVWWRYWWYDSHNHPNWYYSCYYWYWRHWWYYRCQWPFWYTWWYGWYYGYYWHYWSTWFPW